ncbi:hypothetical protein PR048_030314 [Dryococelus australis]|uniref:TTF-type domain-containing protein n=1 Tax=Dryococelus australis TaxID=614101 RepID=A0ABQ9G8M2_9NEOP|nr:hypothetical protein PR048_030314 [Dryococelus australis]
MTENRADKLNTSEEINAFFCKSPIMEQIQSPVRYSIDTRARQSFVCPAWILAQNFPVNEFIRRKGGVGSNGPGLGIRVLYQTGRTSQAEIKNVSITLLSSAQGRVRDAGSASVPLQTDSVDVIRLPFGNNDQSCVVSSDIHTSVKWLAVLKRTSSRNVCQRTRESLALQEPTWFNSYLLLGALEIDLYPSLLAADDSVKQDWLSEGERFRSMTTLALLVVISTPDIAADGYSSAASLASMELKKPTSLEKLMGACPTGWIMLLWNAIVAFICMIHDTSHYATTPRTEETAQELVAHMLKLIVSTKITAQSKQFHKNAAENIPLRRRDVGSQTIIASSSESKGWGKQEIPEKTRRREASSGHNFRVRKSGCVRAGNRIRLSSVGGERFSRWFIVTTATVKSLRWLRNINYSQAGLTTIRRTRQSVIRMFLHPSIKSDSQQSVVRHTFCPTKFQRDNLTFTVYKRQRPTLYNRTTRLGLPRAAVLSYGTREARGFSTSAKYCCSSNRIEITARLQKENAQEDGRPVRVGSKPPIRTCVCLPRCWGHVGAKDYSTVLPSRRIGFDSRRGHYEIIDCGNHTGRCLWSTVFSRGSSVFSTLAFRRCSILTSLHPHRISRPRRPPPSKKQWSLEDEPPPGGALGSSPTQSATSSNDNTFSKEGCITVSDTLVSAVGVCSSSGPSSIEIINKRDPVLGPALAIAHVKEGSFQPIDLIFPVRDGMKFRPEWYKKFPWLEYSPLNNRARCFVCRAFYQPETKTKADDAFTLGGFSKWKKAVSVFEKHQKGSSRMSNNVKLASLKESDKSGTVAEKVRVQYSEDVKGSDESTESKSKINFLELTELLSKNSNLIKQFYVERQKNFQYTSATFQNELLSIIGEQIKLHIGNKITLKSLCRLYKKFHGLTLKVVDKPMNALLKSMEDFNFVFDLLLLRRVLTTARSSGGMKERGKWDCPEKGRRTKAILATFLTPGRLHRESNPDRLGGRNSLLRPAVRDEYAKQRADVGQRHAGRVVFPRQAFAERIPQRWVRPIADNRLPGTASGTMIKNKTRMDVQSFFGWCLTRSRKNTTAQSLPKVAGVLQRTEYRCRIIIGGFDAWDSVDGPPKAGIA